MLKYVAPLKQQLHHLSGKVPERHKKRARKTAEGLGERFTDLADWVSSAMGTPVNIIIWVILVLSWTLIFWIHPALQYSNFMPTWFTSLPYNLPLNLTTTVAELFIGFLVAAASNRIERRNHQQMERLDRMEKQSLRMEHEHSKMIAELRDVIDDLHSHTTCTGHTTIGTPEEPPPPPQRKLRTPKEPAA